MKKVLLSLGLLATTLPWFAQAEEYKIEMKFNEDSGDVFFESKELKVASGDTVTFVHADPYNVHNIMFEPNGIPKGADIPMMSPAEMNAGETWSVTLTESGTYKYHCHPHFDMGMAGVIIVDHPSEESDINTEATDHHHSSGQEHQGHH